MLRLGLRMVSGISETVAGDIVRLRQEIPFSSIRDVVQRTGIGTKVINALADADAFRLLAGNRIQSKWMAAASKLPDLPAAPSDISNAAAPLKNPSRLAGKSSPITAAPVSHCACIP